MKKTILITLLVLLISGQFLFSQDIPEDAVMISENTIIKDESGDTIEISRFIEYMNTGEWTAEPTMNAEGQLESIQLKKATEEDKKRLSQGFKPGSSSELIGKSAPDFTMKDLNGNIISNKNSRGKVVVLNFWFTACKPCIAELPDLNDVYEKYKDNEDVVFASVTFEDSKSVISFLEKHEIKYPLVTEAKEVCNLFKVSGYPTNIVIDREGNFLDITGGGFPSIGNHISKSIETALESEVK